MQRILTLGTAIQQAVPGLMASEPALGESEILRVLVDSLDARVSSCLKEVRG